MEYKDVPQGANGIASQGKKLVKNKYKKKTETAVNVENWRLTCEKCKLLRHAGEFIL